MAQIDRPGLFKGLIRDHAVNLTSQKKLPQFVVTFAATELWDEVNEAWISWEDYGQLITGYFVLVSLDENGQVVRCLNYDQIMKALGWDGATFAGLGAGDWRNKPVQFRVIPDTYEGRTNLKVNWIDNVDADVGLRKLSAADLSKLDSQYGGTASKPKPAGAPAPAPAAPKVEPASPAKKIADELNALAAPVPATVPEVKAPPKIGAPKPPALAVDTPARPTTCTMEQAYADCVAVNEELGDKKVPEDILDDYWQTQAVEIAENTDKITPIEWAKIRDAVIADLGIPF